MPALWVLGPEVLIAVFGALAFCLLAVYIGRALGYDQGGALGWILSQAGWIRVPLTRIQQRIVHYMAQAAAEPQKQVGAALHDSARLVDATAQELQTHAQILALIAQAIPDAATRADLQAAAGRLEKRVGNAEAQARGIGADVLPRIQAVEKGIGADVLPQIRALDKEVAGIEGKTIPALRGQVRAHDRAIGNLWEWIKGHTLLAASTAFAGAVAFALARVGAGWTRCNNWNRVGRQVCGMDSGLLESLLADALLVVGTLSLVEFAEEMVGVTEVAVRPIQTFWRAT